MVTSPGARGQRTRRPARGGPDLTLLLRVAQKAQVGPAPAIARQRELFADFIRAIGRSLGYDGQRPGIKQGIKELRPTLPKRMSETLEGLLAGDSEKQIANRLHLSRHTVHVYVKALYRRHSASSRGELLARFIPPGVAAGAKILPPGQTPVVPSHNPPDSARYAGNSGPRNGNGSGNGHGNGHGNGNGNGHMAADGATNQLTPEPRVRAIRPPPTPSPRQRNPQGDRGGLTKED